VVKVVKMFTVPSCKTPGKMDSIFTGKMDL